MLVFITTLGVVVLIDAAKCTTRRFMFVYLILVYANLVYAMVSVYIKGANMDELAIGLNLRRMKQWLYLGVFTHFTQIVLHVIFDKKEETFAIIKNGRYRSEVQKMEKQRKLDKAQKRRQLKSIDVSKIFNTHVRATRLMPKSPLSKTRKSKQPKSVNYSKSAPSLTIQTRFGSDKGIADKVVRSSSLSVMFPEELRSPRDETHTPGRTECDDCGCIRGSRTRLWCGCGRTGYLKTKATCCTDAIRRSCLVERLALCKVTIEMWQREMQRQW